MLWGRSLKIKKKLTPILIVLLAGIGFLIYSNSKQEGFSAEATNKIPSKDERVPAKDFSFQDLDGSDYSLSDFKGKVIIVNFRTISCSACDTEVDFLKTFVPSLDRSKIEFIPLFLGDKKLAIESYLKQKGADFPVYSDDYGLSALKYGVFGLPSSFIIDKDFRAVAKIPGAIDWNQPEIIGFLQALINE